MISRVLNDDRARRAARHLRVFYGLVSALWMMALGLFAAWMLFASLF